MSLSIYVHSTAPWSFSSYSVLVSRTLPNIVRDGHRVNLGVWYGLQGQPLPWAIAGKDGKQAGTVTVFPSVDGPNYGVQTMIPNYKYTNSDCLITISDVWVFPAELTRQAVFCPWLPIDHDPAPKPVVDSLETAVYPMVYSEFGRRVLEERHGIKTKYVPCSAPANVFKPGDKQQARELIGFPADADFVASIVSANKDPMDRKGFAEGLVGFARFAEKHDRAYLYLHTNWRGNVQIAPMIESLGIKSRVIKPDPYGYDMGMLDDAYMANVYRASDVLLNTCKSEGFGLPLVEAQMCGTPVAVTDFATTDELMFAGWKMAGQPDWSNGLNSWRLRVYVDSVVDALEEAYRNKDNEKLQRRARNGAMRYDNDTVFNQFWRPALKDIEDITSRSKAVYDVAKSLPLVAVP